MSPKRTRPKNLGTNPPSALVTYPGTPTFPCNGGTNASPRIRKQTFTPNGREAIADLTSLSSGIIDSCLELTPFLGPFRAKPFSSRLVFGTGLGRRCPLSAQSCDLGKRVLSSWPLGLPCPRPIGPAFFSITAPRRLKLTAGLLPSSECVYQLSRTKDIASRGNANSSFARPSSTVINEGPSKRCNCPAS